MKSFQNLDSLIPAFIDTKPIHQNSNHGSECYQVLKIIIKIFLKIIFKIFNVILNLILFKFGGQTSLPVADPEFPVGGVDLVGGIDFRGGYISKILCVETKESGPLGVGRGACAGHAPLRSANASVRGRASLPGGQLSLG